MKTSLIKKSKWTLIIIIQVFAFLIFILSACETNQFLIFEPVQINNECDTTNVSYSKTVAPLLSQCIPCHNKSTNYSGVVLDGYDNIKTNALNGKLLTSIGKGSSMNSFLSNGDCDYFKIQAWIRNSTPNN